MQQPLIAIVGETATGKSAVAMSIAQRFDGEIVNADSWQIYRGMDIGTAKPTPEERELVPHHLIDIVEPDADFNAAIYKRLADETIRTTKLPVLVGGTGLYVDSVLFDYSFLPPGAPGQREELQAMSIPELLARIHDRGHSLDGIDIRNKRRLIRLLENEGREPDRAPLRENTCVIGVYTTRSQLRKNIESRVERMFRSGLKHEVRDLAQAYGWEVEAMKGIGYREFHAYFESHQSLTETKRKIIKSTLELAKRQRTWFKRNRQIQWVQSAAEAESIVKRFLDKVY